MRRRSVSTSVASGQRAQDGQGGLVVANHAAFWGSFRGIGGVVACEVGGFSLVFTGIPHVAFNVVTPTDAVAGSGDVVTAFEVATNSGDRFGWWTHSLRPEGEADLLRRLGMLPRSVLPGMVLDLRAEARTRRLAAPLTVEEVAAPGTPGAATWSDVLAESFGIHRDHIDRTVDLFLGCPATREGRMRHYLGRDGAGRAVCCGSMLFDGTSVGLYNIGTVVSERGRGRGARMTEALVEAARETGARWAVLQATDLGHSVYRRAGFEDVIQFTELAYP